MKNIALRIAYEGTAYHGWQSQKSLPTVSDTLSRALESVTGSSVRLTGCGRTDAGVHARTYVTNFYSDTAIPLDRLPYAVNPRLPKDISVYQAVEVPTDFHAVFSSIRKEYTYLIYRSRIPNPFYANRAYFYPIPLRLDLMREAASRLIGEHDFKGLRSLGSNVKTTVRTVFACEIEEDGEQVCIRIAANGFLYNMARTIAGTLIYVSEQKISPPEIDRILLSGERSAAGPTLPACGLYMTGVWYPDNIW